MSRPIFLGGSLHKTKRYIDTYDNQILRVPVHPSLDEYRSLLEYWNGTGEFGGPELKVEEYQKTNLNLFGLTLEVWVERNEKDRVWALAIDALMSDYAKDGVWK